MLAGAIGLAVAFHLPARLWQSLAALGGGQFTGLLDRATPFDRLTSPHPLFPLVALALWLQGALGLLWLGRSTRIAAEPGGTEGRQSQTGDMWRRGLGGLGLALAVGLGFLNRAAQLLPDGAGRFPASDYDEMVYFQGASLIAQGHLPYRDFFLAHPPGAEFLYSLCLKLGLADGGGPNGLSAARWGEIGLGLLTIGGVFWVAGWMWSARTTDGHSDGEKNNRFAWGPGLAAAFVYAADARAATIATLEAPANFGAIAGLGLYFGAERVAQGRLRKGLWLAAGAFLALAMLCKLPALAFGLALLIYLVFKREWPRLAWVLGGMAAGGAIILGPLVLAAGPGEVLRQAVLFQLLRPQEVREGLDQIGRLADTPDNALTFWLAGLVFLLLALRLIWPGRTRASSDGWLVAALASLPLMAVLTLGKSFHPWYYVQMALPLALLAGGLFSATLWGAVLEGITSRRVKAALTAGLGLGLVVAGGPLLGGQWQEIHNARPDEVYRPVAAALTDTAPILEFDPGYSFVAGRLPARLPVTGKFLVDSAGYMVYLNLDLDRRSLPDLLGAALSSKRERGPENNLFRQERAQALVTEGLVGAGWAVLDGKLALPQLTPRTVEFVAAAGSGVGRIGQADLYRLRPLALRRPWRLANGLVVTPVGLGTALAGRANADPVVIARDGGSESESETISLSAKDAAQRSLEVRLLWRVERPANAIKVFVHLIDEKGQRVAQRDIRPQDGLADTSQWRPGDAFQDVHGLPLPAGLPAGRYRVETGAYDAATGDRIAIEDQASLIVGYLVITP